MDLMKVYKLGWDFQFIRLSKYTHPTVKGDNYLLSALKSSLDILKEYSLSSKTRNEIDKLIIKFEESYNEDDKIKDEDAELLFESVKLWRDRITNELVNIKNIEVFTNGTLNPNKLLDGGKSFFPEEVWEALSDISKSDLNDACNCLLTESWTPAVMISLRAAEDTIRNIHIRKIKGGNPRIGWKRMLDELIDTKGINKTLFGYLNYIREIRNTAEHPDQIFDQMEAERVFHQVVNMIIVINQELFPKKPLSELSVKELKIKLKIKKLKMSGKKTDLIERLQEANQSLN